MCSGEGSRRDGLGQSIGHDVLEYRIARHGPTVQLAPLFARDGSGMALTARW